MRKRLSYFLMRLALRLVRPGPFVARVPMDDEAIASALCVPADHPLYRAMLELLHRLAEAAQRDAFAERNAARNAIKTTFYVASAGSHADAIAYLEAARVASMGGRKVEEA